jgi:hypothetical protein
LIFLKSDLTWVESLFILSDTDTEDESDHRAATAKTKVVKKTAKKQKEADQVDKDFDVFAEEPRRRSSIRQSFA